MLRTLLSTIISFFSLMAWSDAYVCTFEYYEKIARFEKDAVSARHLLLIPSDECSKDKVSQAQINIGKFDVMALCDGKLNLTISQGQKSLWNTIVLPQDFAKPLDKSLLLAGSGLRFSCVEREVGMTCKIAQRKVLNF